jgi:hypothetical protein
MNSATVKRKYSLLWIGCECSADKRDWKERKKMDLKRGMHMMRYGVESSDKLMENAKIGMIGWNYRKKVEQSR